MKSKKKNDKFGRNLMWQMVKIINFGMKLIWQIFHESAKSPKISSLKVNCVNFNCLNHMKSFKRNQKTC